MFTSNMATFNCPPGVWISIKFTLSCFQALFREHANIHALDKHLCKIAFMQFQMKSSRDVCSSVNAAAMRRMKWSPVYVLELNGRDNLAESLIIQLRSASDKSYQFLGVIYNLAFIRQKQIAIPKRLTKKTSRLKCTCLTPHNLMIFTGIFNET